MPLKAKKRILVIEDDPFIAEVLSIRLELAGYEASVVANGNLAYEAACDFKPDAAILDIGLPGKDGFEVLRDFNNPDAKYFPVLMLTARSRKEDIATAFGLGAKDYVSKPFDDKKLLAKVEKLFRLPHNDNGYFNYAS